MSDLPATGRETLRTLRSLRSVRDFSPDSIPVEDLAEIQGRFMELGTPRHEGVST
jgi:hypothetical protein